MGSSSETQNSGSVDIHNQGQCDLLLCCGDRNTKHSCITSTVDSALVNFFYTLLFILGFQILGFLHIAGNQDENRANMYYGG